MERHAARASTLVPRDIAGMSADASRLSFLPAGHPQGYADCFDLFVADAHAVARGEAPADGMPLFADGMRSAQIVEAVLASAARAALGRRAGRRRRRWRHERAAPILEVRGLEKEYPGVRALQGVDFDVRPGEVHCLLGPNGAGKSTLIKCVSGAVEPTRGEILVGGEPLPVGAPSASIKRGVATIYQELDLVEDLTVTQSVFLGHELRRGPLLDRDAMKKRTVALLERLDHASIPPGAHVRALRPAAQQVVSIARALSHDIRVLIMDEPSAILDDEEVETLFGVVRRLKDEGVGVIYISHRLDEIPRIGDRVTVLSDGRTVATGLPADTPQGVLVEHMVGRKVDQLYPARSAATGDVMLSVRGVSGAPMVKETSFEVRAGEVVGIGGLVGAGRTELLRLVYGLDKPDTGEVHVDGKQAPGRQARRGDRRRARARARGPQVAGPAARLEPDQERHALRPRPLPPRAADRRRRRARRGRRAAARAQDRARRPGPDRRASSRAATSRRSCSRAGCCASARCCCSTSPRAASTSAPRPRSTR